MTLVSGLLAAGSGLALLAAAGWAASPDSTAAKPPQDPKQIAFFESKIRPVLVKSCFSCHGDKDQKGGLRLDSRDAVLKGGRGGAVLVAGDPGKSRLLQAVHYDGALKMPPAGKLTDLEIAALTEWIKMGAPWPDPVPAAPGMVIKPEQRNFWSFQPVRKPALPSVKNAAWCRNPIDRFILAQLEAKGLAPAPQADRRTMIRRVTLDLIGLPPTPAEIEAFVNDKSPNAWEKVIDRLLASPQYGERWGRHWLDVVRYADSNGLDENVAFAHAWKYRDYVVNAFNKDKPYDAFVKEQLAGDLLPTTDDDQRNERITATGFLNLGAKVLAEPDKDKMVMDIIDEQIEVTSKAFMGLTVACARCHDHKFDPIPTKDYYALAGIFKSTKSMASLTTVAMWNERPLVSKDMEVRKRAHEQKLQAAKDALKAAEQRAAGSIIASVKQNAGKYLLAGWELSRQPGQFSMAELPDAPGGAHRVVIEAEKFNRGNVGIDRDNFGKGIGIILNVGTPDFAEWDITVPEAGNYQVELRYASAEHRPVKLSLNGQTIKEKTAGEITGSFNPDTQRWEVQGVFPFKTGKNTLRMDCPSAIPHFDKVFVVAVPSAPGTGKPARTVEQIAGQYGITASLVKLAAASIGGLPSDPATLPDMERSKASEKLAETISAAIRQKPEGFLDGEAKTQIENAMASVKALEGEAPKPEVVMAVEDTRPENVKVHIRGDTQNLGEEVPRHFLTVLGGDNPALIENGQSGRRDFAEWLTSPSHPLTSRVAVNRVWQAHFGEGLVRTPDNWGFLGLKPSHPELLDWLAAEFSTAVSSSQFTDSGSRGAHPSAKPVPADPYACGWSFKKLHRLIMTSNAYQMSTVAQPAALAKAALSDPDNKLLWHMPRRRMEAEPIRDSILAIAGKLDTTMGGTLLKTGNHDYVTNDQSGNAAAYNSPRRSLYLPIIRNALFDMFQAFDFGDPTMVNAKRSTTTIAPQALYVMNSPFILEQSKAFAADLLAKAKSDSERLKEAYMRVFARPPSAAEAARATAFISRYAESLKSEPDANKRHEKSWAALCQILLASNEFIFVN